MKLYYESKPGELEHGLFGTIKKRAKAKYIHKIPLGNGQFRYFYTQEELDAYNNKAKKNRSNAEQVRRSNIEAKRNAAYNKTSDIRKEAAEYQKEADRRDRFVKSGTEAIETINNELAKEKKSLGGIFNTIKSRDKQSFLEGSKIVAEKLRSANAYERDSNLRKAKQKYDERDKIVNDIMRGSNKKKKKKK